MIQELIRPVLEKAVQQVCPNHPTEISLDSPQNADHGDLSCNIAMMLSKKVGKNPRELAQEIIDQLPESPYIAKTDIAGPGFINLWLSEAAYQHILAELSDLQKNEQLGVLAIGQGKKAITDSSHPNIAKPMGVHHLLSTILGQALNNLLQTAGYEVVRDNYVGDWGTQYGKLIVALQTWGDLETIKKDPIPELLKLYVKFHEEAEKKPELEEEGRKRFKKLEEGDPELLELWNWIRDVSLEECDKTWQRLGAEFDLFNSESFYEDKMEAIITRGLEQGVITEGEEGALIITMDDENKPPAIIRKKDGATLYATRDLARIQYWQDELQGDLGVNVVDVAQKLYFEQLFESAEKLGFTKMQHIHVDFGRMSFPEGGMSTRKGKVILLENVLDEAEKRALEKIEEHESGLPEAEKEELARKMGIGAVKYNVLSQNRQKNYTFVWDQMLSFDGNSAPYLQYAFTRTQSILRKAAEQEVVFDEQDDWSLSAAEEHHLLKKLDAFDHALARSLEEYKPNHLCTYLFELAQIFSQLYNNLRILDAESPAQQKTRLKLIELVAAVLKKGLDILGIEVPDRM